MLEKTNVKTLDKGDGMQLAGNIFTNVSAGLGNQVSTFPDYPAEIRAPQGSLGGVSGFQVSVGTGVHTPGDACDVLSAMTAVWITRACSSAAISSPLAWYAGSSTVLSRPLCII